MSQKSFPKASEAVCLTITVVMVMPADWPPGGDLGPIRAALEEALARHAPDAHYGWPPVTITAVTLPEVRT